MRWVSPQDLVDELLALKGSGRFALVFDYDGTLAEISPTPNQARLEHAMRERLLRLCAHPGVQVALITGRSRDSLVELMGPMAGVTLVTNGGLRITDDQGDWIAPEAEEKLGAVQQAMLELEPEVSRWEGAFIEDKRLTFTVHYRQAPGAHETLTRATVEAVDRAKGALCTVPGKYGIDVQPNIRWDKGRALLQLLDRWGIEKRAAFFGDDHIDEPAFEALRKRGGVTCCIAEHPRPTAAATALRSVSQLGEVLDLLNASFGRGLS